MSARTIEAACITLPLLGSGHDENNIIQHPKTSPARRETLQALAQSIQAGDKS
ncbi:hypothetical protein [Acidihalobacter yilgarnensis]|uniref:hypothetical protein n=1 Tax=Acidihalobacter yilgarnensis TaxID=2819280 RepID=UPI0012EA96A4|nr:hypothetical protein [Acidihalobacter yilgarnensis]